MQNIAVFDGMVGILKTMMTVWWRWLWRRRRQGEGNRGRRRAEGVEDAERLSNIEPMTTMSQAWSALGAGLQAAEVNDMSFSSEVGLVVVGTIYRSGGLQLGRLWTSNASAAGETALSNVVRWDFSAGKWQSLGEFDKTVRAGEELERESLPRG
eukprot:757379-Hanusia_phi.AAC.8